MCAGAKIFIVIGLFLCSIVDAKVIYVNKLSVGSNNGTSWSDAFTTVQSAVAAAVSGDTVVVAKGIYTTATGVFTLKDKVKILGGFAGDEAQINAGTIANRNFITNQTTLSADINGNDNDNIYPTEPTRSDNSSNVVKYNLTTTLTEGTMLDGFTISGGKGGSFGGGIDLSVKVATIKFSNLIIEKNSAASNGGGMYISTQSSAALNLEFNKVKIRNNLVYQTSTSTIGSGAGVHIACTNNTQAILFKNVEIKDNITHAAKYANGGGIRIRPDGVGTVLNFVMDSAIISGNKTIEDDGGGSGGAFFIEPSNNSTFTGTFKNILLSRNTSSIGGAVYALTGLNGAGTATISMINATIAYNTAGTGSAFYMDGANTQFTFKNTLMHGNSGATKISSGSSNYTSTYSLIHTSDPRFYDEGINDYRLINGSPALGTGDATSGTNIGYYQGSGINKVYISNLPDIITFLPVTPNNPSDQVSFTFQASNVTGTLAITVPEGFQLSETSNQFDPVKTSISLSPDGAGEIPSKTIYVRYLTAITGNVSGHILFEAGNGSYSRTLEASCIPNKIVYVKNNASGSNNGTSWANAYVELYDAVATLKKGDTLAVAAGTYYPAFGSLFSQIQIPAGIKAFGSFAGNEVINEAAIANRNLIDNKTIVSGDVDKNNNISGNTYGVIKITGDSKSVLDGFEITGANNIISNADYCGINASGGGKLANLKLINNRSYKRGGGMYLADGTYDIENVTFDGNYTYGSSEVSYGGAIFANNASLQIKNATFSRNEARKLSSNYVGFIARGGAIYTEGGSLSLTNVSFGQNKCYNNFNLASTENIYNTSGNITAVNTIFEMGGVVLNSGTFNISYCYYYNTLPTGTTDGGNNLLWSAANNYQIRYYNPSGGDLRLVGNSDCINKGNTTYGPNIGSYQEGGLPSPVITITGTLVDFGSIITNTYSAEQSYTISAQNLSSDLDISVNAGFQISLISGTYLSNPDIIKLIPVNGSITSTPIYVRFNPVYAQNYAGTITHYTNNATAPNLEVTGKGTPPPSITIYQSSADFGETGIGESKTGNSISFNAQNLLGPIKIKAPEGFYLSTEPGALENYKDSIEIPATQPNISGIFYTMFKPAILKDYIGTITLNTHLLAATKTVNVSGKGVVKPILTVTPQVLDFGKVYTGKSATKKIHLQGTNLTSEISITGGYNFLYSLDSTKFPTNTQTITIAFSKPNIDTMVYIRFSPSSNLNISEMLSFTSAGANEKNVNLKAVSETKQEILNLSNYQFDLGTIKKDSSSIVNTFTLSGSGLPDTVKIIAPSEFRISNSADKLSSSTNKLSIITNNGELIQYPVHFKIIPTQTGIINQSIQITGLQTTNNVGVNYQCVVQITLGVPETTNMLVKVFPNPATDYLMVSILGKHAGDLKLTAFDVKGTQYKPGFTAISDQELKIDLTGLPSGYLLFHMESKQFSESFRILKQN